MSAPARQPAKSRRPRRAPTPKERNRPRRADSGGLAVALSTSWTDGRTSDTRRIELTGTAAGRRRRNTNAVRSVEARDAAARRIARGARPEILARLLAAIAHPQRAEILLKLLGGEATHRSLAKTTGLKAGPLYHHLRELRMAGLIGPKVRDLYVLTARGARAILATMAIERLCR
jgi:DNA-binding transcriptional ArsR family regulator